MLNSVQRYRAASLSNPHLESDPQTPPPEPEVDPGRGRADEQSSEGAKPETTVDPVDKGDKRKRDEGHEPGR